MVNYDALLRHFYRLSVTMTYWGLIFSLGNLSGSFYLNYQLTS